MHHLQTANHNLGSKTASTVHAKSSGLLIMMKVQERNPCLRDGFPYVQDSEIGDYHSFCHCTEVTVIQHPCSVVISVYFGYNISVSK
jgi:hypothetical protein